MRFDVSRFLRFTDEHGEPVALPTAVVAEVCGVSPRTVARWRKLARVPAPELRLYAAGRVLPPIWARHGFRFAPSGDLAPHAGRSFNPSELACYGMNLRRLEELKRLRGELAPGLVDLGAWRAKKSPGEPGRGR